ncbi:MAG: DUF1415 domain-containing protein [Saprospiraceae bacterium]|nr:DUF1415 domain-containing protein [Saprospiraceae bacterium]
MKKVKQKDILQITKNWLNTFVLGLNLCPFARHPLRHGKVRFVVFEGNDLEALTETFVRELAYLDQTPPSVCDTTLIILGEILSDFEDYLDFIEMSEIVVEQLDLEGVFQVASFHPDYQFEETEPFEAENYTNRSPFPIIHLLRENSVTRAIEAFPEVGDIPARNIETMNNLGLEKIKKMLDEVRKTH